MTFHTETMLLTLLNAFNVVDLEEEKEQGVDVEENPVSWHVFHVVARLCDRP